MDEAVRRVTLLVLPALACARVRTAPAILVPALLAFASGGCEPATSSDTAIRSDSAGVEIVEYPRLPPIEESRIAIAAEPDLVLGAGGALEGLDDEFFQITGVSQLRDGTLVVAIQGSRELRFYGADGQFIRSAGRAGDGPGEFRGVQGPWIIEGDTIVVFDASNRRFQHFGPDGAFVRSTSMVAAPFTEFAGPGPQAILEDGRVVVFIPSLMTPTLGVPERRPLLVALHRIGDGGWDSVRVVPGFTRLLTARGDQGALQSRDYSYAGYPVAAGAGATMAVADAARFHVELFDQDGRLVSIISASVPEIPVTADVLEGKVEHYMAHAPGRAAGQGPAREAYEERIRESVLASHAPFLPAIRAVFVDADERIWVERYDVPARGPSRWEVFERDGTWVGRVEMPEGFARGRRAWYPWVPYFSVASGRLAGVWTDAETGVETVRVYRVIEPD